MKGNDMTVKEKFSKAKEKAKSHAPEIAAIAAGLALATIGLISVKNSVKTVSDVVFEPLVPVDDATRNRLMKDADFLLYELTENEYLLDRPVPQQ
jgi:hypothetical protein